MGDETPPSVDPFGPAPGNWVHPAATDLSSRSVAGTGDSSPASDAPVPAPGAVADILDSIWARVEQYQRLDAVAELDPREQPTVERIRHLEHLLGIVRIYHEHGPIRSTLTAVAAHAVDWLLILDEHDEPKP